MRSEVIGTVGGVFIGSGIALITVLLTTSSSTSVLLFIGLFLLVLGIIMGVGSFTFFDEDNRDKKKVYSWLYKKTIEGRGHELTEGNFDDVRWQTIEDIADSVDLTPERVREICSIDKRIRRQKEDEYNLPPGLYVERWGLREFLLDIPNRRPPY